MITQTIDAADTITWDVASLLLEATCPSDDRFWVIVRYVGCDTVLWDGTFPTRGRTLADLPAADFTQEVLARVVREQADRLGRFVYTQDQFQIALRDFAGALPESFRP
jgi:hypothetical protein